MHKTCFLLKKQQFVGKKVQKNVYWAKKIE
jgi:hypothetical protein